MVKKLIIFDLDGTLLDTLEDLHIARNQALEQYGFPVKTLSQTRIEIGNGVKKLIARGLPNGEDNPLYNDVFQSFRNYYFQNYNNATKPYQDVLETLLFLKKKGYILAVATNKCNSLANTLVNYYYINIFDMILGEDPIRNKKPYPDMMYFVLSELKINPEDALYIGDSEIDYEFANNANVDCYLLTTGYRNEKELQERAPNAKIIYNIKNLIKLL